MVNKELNIVLDSFLDSYAERDKSVEFSDWLKDKLREEIPDLSAEAGEKLAGEIIQGIADYDKTLDELNRAADLGQSKEEWFAERMGEVYTDMPLNDVGTTIQRMENDLTVSNMRLMQKNKLQMDEMNTAESGSVEWNEYSIKDKVYKLAKQIGLSGIAVAANIVKDRVEGNETIDISEVVKNTLQDGLKKEPQEVKAAVAGAVKAAAMKELEGVLPEDIPIETVCDMAGAAVEGAEALLDVASGESTMTEAMDKIGRAGVAAGCRYGASSLKGYLLTLPLGPVLVDLLGGLLDHMESPKFSENVYHVVHDAAIATWEGIKRSVGRKINMMANAVSN